MYFKYFLNFFRKGVNVNGKKKKEGSQEKGSKEESSKEESSKEEGYKKEETKKIVIV